MHFLLVDDDERLAHLIQRVLTQERHTVEVAYDGTRGGYLAQGGAFDLIILDRLLPDMDGLDLCERLRAVGVQTPVLMLTARDAVGDRVDGLNAGADDYLVKPFAMAELVARVNARLRRDQAAPVTTVLTVGDLKLDLLKRAVVRAGEDIELTQREFALLEFLMRNAGVALPRYRILEHVWQYEPEANAKVVDTYVHYLREKVDRDHTPGLIKTVRGVGYKLEAR